MAKEKGKASFILYFEYKDYFEQLSVEERGELITAIFDYVVTGETKKLKGASEMAFAFIRAQIQRDLDKYEERCRVNKENGALSHKGKKESLSKPSQKDQSVANGTLNDNVPVPEDESVPESVSETDSVPEVVSESVAVAETESAHPSVAGELRQSSTIRQEKQKATENDGIRQFDKNGGIRQSTTKEQEREREKEREKEREREKELKKEAERERESNLRILGCLERMRRKADRISYLTEKIQGVENPVYSCFGLEQRT